MAASARALARAVSTPEFEGLLLSRSILVWNGRRGIAIKKARKERHPPKKVLCPTDVESRDRRGFIQLPNSVCFHGPRGMKCKILKGAEEHQVEINVVRITVVATLGCIDGTQSTFEEELRTHNPQAVWVGDGRSNVVTITAFSNVVWIGGNSCNAVLS
jgi:hypothetical protein